MLLVFSRNSRRQDVEYWACPRARMGILGLGSGKPAYVIFIAIVILLYLIGK